jgi:galactokinase
MITLALLQNTRMFSFVFSITHVFFPPRSWNHNLCIFPNLVKLTSESCRPRWDALASSFKERFGRLPAFIARAPGRVNLIGEHIDYALFGVFPAAVERDILIACAPRQGSNDAAGLVRAENLDGKYQPQQFAPVQESTAWSLDIVKKQLRWESYVKAGYYVRGLLVLYRLDAER